MKRKLLAGLLCFTMLCTITACGQGNNNGTENPGGTTGTVEQPKVTTLAEHDDLTKILKGDYAISEEKILDSYYEVMCGAGLGLIEVTDRDTVQAGDIVITDYTGYLDGEAFQGGAATDVYIDVSGNCGYDETTGASSNGFITGFTDGLVGAKKGEATSSEAIFPENYGNEDLAGKTTTFEFKVKSIYVKRAPEMLDDAFVVENLKDKYEVSTVAEFMTLLEEDLAYVYVMNYVINNSVVDIPSTYVASRLDEYSDHMINFYYGGEEQLSTMLTYYGMTMEQLKAEFAEELENAIKSEIVFKAMVEQDQLTQDEESLNEYVANVIKINGKAFPDEETFYKAVGSGNAEFGKEYLLNQRAARAAIIEKYSVEE